MNVYVYKPTPNSQMLASQQTLKSQAKQASMFSGGGITAANMGGDLHSQLSVNKVAEAMAINQSRAINDQRLTGGKKSKSKKNRRKKRNKRITRKRRYRL